MVISYLVQALKGLAQLPELAVEALSHFDALLECMDQTKLRSSRLLQHKAASLLLV
jgi:hypothetical protein